MYRFHLLKPSYVYSRVKALQRAYRLRILLCYVDTEDAVAPLAEVGVQYVASRCDGKFSEER